MERSESMKEWNPKTFPVGSVVYFVKKSAVQNNGKSNWTVGFGTVLEYYSDGILLQRYDLARKVYLNGVLSTEMEFPQLKFNKLPKGWTWNTQLLNVEIVHPYDEAEAKQMRINNPQDILTAIEKGILVLPSENDYREYRTSITKDGWKIYIQHDNVMKPDPHPAQTLHSFHEVYGSYAECMEIIEARDAELHKQAEMSDLEWSIQEIDKVLDKTVFCAEDKEAIRNRLLSLPNVEDVEIRWYNGCIQYKRWGKKPTKWRNIEL